MIPRRQLHDPNTTERNSTAPEQSQDCSGAEKPTTSSSSLSRLLAKRRSDRAASSIASATTRATPVESTLDEIVPGIFVSDAAAAFRDGLLHEHRVGFVITVASSVNVRERMAVTPSPGPQDDPPLCLLVADVVDCSERALKELFEDVGGAGRLEAWTRQFEKISRSRMSTDHVAHSGGGSCLARAWFHLDDDGKCNIVPVARCVAYLMASFWSAEESALSPPDGNQENRRFDVFASPSTSEEAAISFLRRKLTLAAARDDLPLNHDARSASAPQRPYPAILIHCLKGMSRSIAVVAALLLLTGMESTAEAALSACKRARPIASPNMSYRVQLLLLERQLLVASSSSS